MDIKLIGFVLVVILVLIITAKNGQLSKIFISKRHLNIVKDNKNQDYSSEDDGEGSLWTWQKNTKVDSNS